MLNQNKRLINLLLGSLCLVQMPLAHAFTWADLWARPDQQATRLLAKGKPKDAATRFVDPKWQAVANYRAGQYQEAEQHFKSLDSADSMYNQGNALAHLGKYKEAINAFDETLKINPNDKDALYNRELLKKLLENKKKKEQNKQDPQQTKKKDKKNKKQANNKNKSNKKKKQPKSQSSAGQYKKQQQAAGNGNKNQPADKKQAPKANDSQQAKNANNKQNTKPQPDKKGTLEKKHANPANGPEHKASAEQRQASKALLRRIPDDPGGLLRQKFLRDHFRIKQNRS